MTQSPLLDTSTFDIEYVSRIIGRIVDDYVRKMEQKARRENGTVEFLINLRDSAELAADIRRTLLALDEARTQNLRLLREQLTEALMLNPKPMIWVGSAPKEPSL